MLKQAEKNITREKSGRQILWMIVWSALSTFCFQNLHYLVENWVEHFVCFAYDDNKLLQNRHNVNQLAITGKYESDNMIKKVVSLKFLTNDFFVKMKVWLSPNITFIRHKERAVFVFGLGKNESSYQTL